MQTLLQDAAHHQAGELTGQLSSPEPSPHMFPWSADKAPQSKLPFETMNYRNVRIHHSKSWVLKNKHTFIHLMNIH